MDNLIKFNLAKAFLKVGFSSSTILKLAIAVPRTLSDKDPLIAAIMVLLMEWMESPLILCTVTKTIADLANAKIA